MARGKKNNNTEEPIEKQLWKAADKLRKNIDAAEYKHIRIGIDIPQIYFRCLRGIIQ